LPTQQDRLERRAELIETLIATTLRDRLESGGVEQFVGRAETEAVHEWTMDTNPSSLFSTGVPVNTMA